MSGSLGIQPGGFFARKLAQGLPKTRPRTPRRFFFLGVLVGLIVGALGWGASHGEASCGFGCLHRQIEAIRRQALPRRVSALEERLEADEARIEAQGAHIARLEAQAAHAETTASKLIAAFQCFGEIPLTRYGSELGPSGYLFHLEGPNPLTIPTTALDISYPKDPVGAWVLANACDQRRLAGSLAEDARGFVDPRNEQLIAVERPGLIQDFIRQQH